MKQKIVQFLHLIQISAIKFKMEQQGLSLNYLEMYFGTIEKVKAFLDGKLQLTLDKKLHQGLHIPLESLIDG